MDETCCNLKKIFIKLFNTPSACVGEIYWINPIKPHYSDAIIDDAMVVC